MIFEKDRVRPVIIRIFGIALVILTLFSWFNASFLNVLDELVTKATSPQSGIIWLIMLIINIVAKPLFLSAITIGFAYFLFQSHYKVPAVWVLFTNASASLMVYLLTWVIHRPAPDKMAGVWMHTTPSLSVVLMILLVAEFFTIVGPELTILTKGIRRNIRFIIVIILLLVIYSAVSQPSATFTDVLFAIIFSYFWLQIMENVYTNYATALLNYQELNDSWI